jgi:hypothetical protein
MPLSRLCAFGLQCPFDFKVAAVNRFPRFFAQKLALRSDGRMGQLLFMSAVITGRLFRTGQIEAISDYNRYNGWATFYLNNTKSA